MRTCYIVGAGDFFGELSPKEDDLVIAADGGYDTLLRLGIRCDLLLGDMDSIRSGADSESSLFFPPEKDDTDTALAYREGVRRGYTNFRMYGCTGGRCDHTFANYILLTHIKDSGHSATLIDNGYEIFAIKNEKITVNRSTGTILSIFAFGKEAAGVTLSGLKYPLCDYTLSPGVALGVSNEFTSDKATVEVKDGLLLVMVADKIQKNT